MFYRISPSLNFSGRVSDSQGNRYPSQTFVSIFMFFSLKYIFFRLCCWTPFVRNWLTAHPCKRPTVVNLLLILHHASVGRESRRALLFVCATKLLIYTRITRVLFRICLRFLGYHFSGELCRGRAISRAPLQPSYFSMDLRVPTSIFV